MAYVQNVLPIYERFDPYYPYLNDVNEVNVIDSKSSPYFITSMGYQEAIEKYKGEIFQYCPEFLKKWFKFQKMFQATKLQNWWRKIKYKREYKRELDPHLIPVLANIVIQFTL